MSRFSFILFYFVVLQMYVLKENELFVVPAAWYEKHYLVVRKALLT